LYAEGMPKACLQASHLLVLLQNNSCMSNSTAAACVQAKMTANEQVHASQIKSWQTRVEVEEERTERIASSLRIDLEDKKKELKVNCKPPILNPRVTNMTMHDICPCALYIILKTICMECTSPPT